MLYEYTHTLEILKGENKTLISVKAHGSSHAQAQATDICRALSADGYNLSYKRARPSVLSDLFKKLAFNEYDYSSCFIWKGKTTNNNPCIYTLRRRYYVRPLILSYLDIPNDCTVRLTCGCELCTNPYHFKYVSEKNSKLTSGDVKMLLAYRSQGARIPQAAKALNVHRSTIYRNLKK